MEHFSPRDMVSHWDVLEVRARPTSLAARFLDGLLERMPFPVAALQVEGGSEFTAEFVQACQQQALPLVAILPRSPQLNGPTTSGDRSASDWDSSAAGNVNERLSSLTNYVDEYKHLTAYSGEG